MNNKLVLIAEDSIEVVRFLEKCFLERKYKVIAVSNGQEAYDKIKANEKEITLIVTDITMPIMSGVELLEKLKNEKMAKEIPKIILTTRLPQEESIEIKLMEDLKCWLLKPVDSDFFNKILDKVEKL
jgi:CheY-like chemotaxis protein